MSDVSQHTSKGYDTDVIVVGAGPVGLTLGCGLRHHGVDFRIFDERMEPKPNSRANNLWARPQELLDSIGIRDALAENAYRIEKQTQFLNGHVLDQVELATVASPFPKVLYSGQDVIERTLADKVGSLERGHKVSDIEQDDDGVTVTVLTVSEDGKQSDPQRLRCRYLVGADGNEGTVRKAIGATFETSKFEGRANRQIDAKLSWQRSTEADQLWFFIYRNGFSGVLPVWEGYHRLFFLEDEAIVPDRDPTLEELQVRAREVTGDDTLTLSDPIWFSHSRFQHGVSSTYAKGRVFLAGDAGHTTLPIGGQGMNAGMSDAVSLAWRLAMTLAGQAEPAVLASYGDERGGEHVALDGRQASGFKHLMYRNPVEDAALGLAAKVVPNLGARLFGTEDLQQLSVAYPKSPLNEDHLGGLRQALRSHVPHAGDRAPDAEVIGAKGATVTLFSHIYNPDGQTWGWCLLAFDGGKEDVGSDLQAAVSAVAGWPCVRPRLVSAFGKVAKAGVKGAPTLWDLDAVAHAAYGLEDTAALVLIRPDGHVAFRGPANQPELLEAYCRKFLGAPGHAV